MPFPFSFYNYLLKWLLNPKPAGVRLQRLSELRYGIDTSKAIRFLKLSDISNSLALRSKESLTDGLRVETTLSKISQEGAAIKKLTTAAIADSYDMQ
jgi:hypothetical protein